MKIAVPAEIKVHEYRAGLVPAAVRELADQGHQLFIQSGAGHGAGFSDEAYQAAGAEILPDAAATFAAGEMIVKVKEPQAAEIALLRPDHLLFTYLHLAADRAQTDGLLASGCTAIAYETVTDRAGHLPLLAPMSEVAGRMAIQAGARCLEKEAGGMGLLLGGVPGVGPARVVILGGGVVGYNAARMACGMGAHVTIFDRNPLRLRELDGLFQGRAECVFALKDLVESAVSSADLVIGAVLVPGAAAPRLVSREMLGQMKPGAVLVDVAIDQGGCFETSRPTTHAEPTYIIDDIVHYCVANMPGAVARTSTQALNNATLPYVLSLAAQGPARALAADPGFLQGLNVHGGKLTCPAVGEAFSLPAISPESGLELLASQG